MTLKIAKPSASGLKIAKPSGSKLRLTSTFSYDTDAAAYITAVETADGQALETATRYAINNFVIGCKQDGIWSAIKASCILAGARTLAGALVPLVGAAPTNYNFVSGDYNRKTGLVGNGSSKYLNSNRAADADPLNNCHLSVYLSQIGTAGYATYIGCVNSSVTSANVIRNGSSGNSIFEFFVKTLFVSQRSPTAIGFAGAQRDNVSEFESRVASSTIRRSAAFSALLTPDLYIFADNHPPPTPRFFANARIAFYSIGESLNLALLDARVTDLINALAAAIP